MRIERPPITLLVSVVVTVLLITISTVLERPILSSWTTSNPFEIARRGVDTGVILAGSFNLVHPASNPLEALQQEIADGIHSPGSVALEAYNQGSVLVDVSPDYQIQYYTRSLESGGNLVYFVVWLGDRAHIEVVNADGAIPGSDDTGDTIWLDGQQHLATVEEIANAPYAWREHMTLMAAMAFGFHGNVRTSNEGTVVINHVIHRVNPGRAALCIGPQGTAAIGLFDEAALHGCAQAIGAGPVILWRGKIANPYVRQETEEFIPFNPLGEDFVQIDWRRKVYMGTYPKSVVGIGTRPDGGFYLIMAVSYGVPGLELARQMKAMGCIDVLGGDDDTSTQAVWRGVPVRDHRLRPVPDALSVYWRETP